MIPDLFLIKKKIIMVIIIDDVEFNCKFIKYNCLELFYDSEIKEQQKPLQYWLRLPNYPIKERLKTLKCYGKIPTSYKLKESFINDNCKNLKPSEILKIINEDCFEINCDIETNFCFVNELYGCQIHITSEYKILIYFDYYKILE